MAIEAGDRGAGQRDPAGALATQRRAIRQYTLTIKTRTGHRRRRSRLGGQCVRATEQRQK
jgi:hypothetical protein